MAGGAGVIALGYHHHIAILDRQRTAAAAGIAPSSRPVPVTNLSGYFKVNLDIGSCTAAHLDPLVYLREHHSAIRTVRLNDRRRNGDSVQWGEGDAPIREVLKLLKREGWPIRAYVDYDYDAAGEVMQELYENGDDITRRIASSFFRFRQDAIRYTKISESAFTNARSIRFDFPKG